MGLRGKKPGPPVEAICQECNKVYPIPSHRASTAKKRKFCSVKCGASNSYRTGLGLIPNTWSKGNKSSLGKSGSSTSFRKGHKTWNKDLKGIHLSPGSEFKKGSRPINWKPVGTERIRIDKTGNPRVWVKVAEPNIWKMRAILVWEAQNGPVPAGSVVHHKDRNSTNDFIENLECLTRGEHMKTHREEFEAARIAALRGNDGYQGSSEGKLSDCGGEGLA